MVDTHKNTSQQITTEKLLEHISSLTGLIGTEAHMDRFPRYDSSIGVAQIKTSATLNHFNVIGLGSGEERIELVFSNVKVSSPNNPFFSLCAEPNKPFFSLCADKDFLNSEETELKIQLSPIELQALVNSGSVDTRHSSFLKKTGNIIRFDRGDLNPLSLLTYPPQS